MPVRPNQRGTRYRPLFWACLSALVQVGCASNSDSGGSGTSDPSTIPGAEGGGRGTEIDATAGGASNRTSTTLRGGASSGRASSSVGETVNGGASSGGTSMNGGTSTQTGARGGATSGGRSGRGTSSGSPQSSGGSSQIVSGTGGNQPLGGASSQTGPSQTSQSVGGTTSSGSSASGAAGSPACTPPAAGTRGTNPLFSDVFTADPAALVDNCTFYIQAGHDEGAGNYFSLYEWYLLKSTDMVHWTLSVGMRYSVFSWAHGNAWAGQMVKNGGKYYWYVPVEQGNGNGQMAIGVAVADSPEGPFKDAIGQPLVDDAFERKNMGFASDGDTPYTIDPTVFVDDDGQAYLHYGGFSRLVNAKLGSDLISISGTMKESTPSCYFESPYLIKRNGIYYEIYACGANPPTIDYATSSSPLGPWTRKGTVLPKMTTLAGQDAATNHAGVAEFAGQWYVVYHVSNGPNGGGTYHRQVAIDKLTFNADGSIQTVKPSSGLSF